MPMSHQSSLLARVVQLTLLATSAVVSVAAVASPVLYTVRTIASGTVGAVSFAEARLTITFSGGTDNVYTTTENGAVVHTNSTGIGRLNIVGSDGRTIRATFRAGEIYVRYDTKLGLVGFASATELADVAANPADSWSASAGTLSLSTTLSDSTLLTGHPRACAVNFAADAWCPMAAAEPLHTDRGDLYLFDPGFDFGDFGPAAIFTVVVLPQEQ